jgi:acyl-CoA synthetase (AMP-forming)/AMP-acid ligase II
MIISGGENVSPAEVERVLLAHPGVMEAAVAGGVDPRWGERVVAAVVPGAGARLTVDDLLAHCRRHLADYKVPREIAIVGALPRNALGKVLRREVAAPMAGGVVRPRPPGLGAPQRLAERRQGRASEG